MELDEYINLEARVSGRMVLLDISATGEENIIEQRAGDQMNDLEYRRRQLEQLQDEVIDIEDLGGGISITDLTLNDFRMDLAEYLKDHADGSGAHAAWGLCRHADAVDDLIEELDDETRSRASSSASAARTPRSQSTPPMRSLPIIWSMSRTTARVD